MKLITRDTDYAIRALCFIAKQKDEVVSAKELVKCLSVPKPFLRKILQRLNKKGFLRSHKGIGGGFESTLKPADITLLELINIFQGPLRLSGHNFKKRMCPEIKRCPLKKILDVIEESLKKKLKTITIESLLRKERR